MDTHLLTVAWEFVSNYWLYIAAGSPVVVALLRRAALAYVRRPKSTTSEIGPYFTDKQLLSPPLTRPAYSDRMAYILAEMSDLAYYQFEGQSGVVDDAVKQVLSLDLSKDANVRSFLDQFSTEVMSGRRLSLTFLKDILGNSRFSLLDVINVGETQGFVCKKITEGESPYIHFPGLQQCKPCAHRHVVARAIIAAPALVYHVPIESSVLDVTTVLDVVDLPAGVAGRAEDDVIEQYTSVLAAGGWILELDGPGVPLPLQLLATQHMTHERQFMMESAP